jgi:dTMP kinase
LSVHGKFITIEGIDGAGKSTQLAWLCNFFEGRGRSVLATREPGGTEIGESLRTLLLHPGHAMHAETETLLIFAARREHIARVILPALADGKVVLCDRFTDATYAYQGYGRGVDLAKLRLLEEWVQGPLQPDLTLLFDIPVDVGRQRAAGSREADRFEREKSEFFERVRGGYLERAKEYPARFAVIDASTSPADIQKQLEILLIKL